MKCLQMRSLVKEVILVAVLAKILRLSTLGQLGLDMALGLDISLFGLRR
jgi:hypothetical protein